MMFVLFPVLGPNAGDPILEHFCELQCPHDCHLPNCDCDDISIGDPDTTLQGTGDTAATQATTQATTQAATQAITQTTTQATLRCRGNIVLTIIMRSCSILHCFEIAQLLSYWLLLKAINITDMFVLFSVHGPHAGDRAVEQFCETHCPGDCRSFCNCN